MNMVKLLSEFISAGNSLIEKYEKKLDYSIESQFIILNGLGESLHYTNHTLFNLIDCEVNNIKDLVLRIDVLLGVGFGVLILCTCILVPFF